MRPDLVVLSEPDIDGDLGLFCAVEPFGVGPIYDEFRQRVIGVEQAKTNLMEACEAHINRDLEQ